MQVKYINNPSTSFSLTPLLPFLSPLQQSSSHFLIFKPTLFSFSISYLKPLLPYPPPPPFSLLLTNPPSLSFPTFLTFFPGLSNFHKLISTPVFILLHYFKTLYVFPILSIQYPSSPLFFPVLKTFSFSIHSS